MEHYLFQLRESVRNPTRAQVQWVAQLVIQYLDQDPLPDPSWKPVSRALQEGHLTQVYGEAFDLAALCAEQIREVWCSLPRANMLKSFSWRDPSSMLFFTLRAPSLLGVSRQDILQKLDALR